MRLACFGDLHSHLFKEFDYHTDNTGSMRLDNIVNTLDTMGQYCLANEIKVALFAGDLFNTRGKVNTIVYNAIYRKVDELARGGIQFIMIPGNHDQYDNSDTPEHSLEAFKKIPNVCIYDQVTIHTFDDFNILCVPFRKNEELTRRWINGYVEMVKAHEGINPTILLAHLGVSGAVTGADSYVMQDAFTPEDLHPDVFKYVVLGHYHTGQMIPGYNNMFYTGCPIQNSFNDEGMDKGFYVIDTNKRWDIQFVPIDAPKFITVNCGVTDEELQSYNEHKDYLRVQLKESEVQSFISRVPQGLQYRIDMQKEYKQESRSDVEIGMSFIDIIKTYAKEHMPEAEEIGLKLLEEVENR